MAEGAAKDALNYTAPQLFPDNNHLGTIPRATGWTSVQGNPANINWLDRWGEIGNDYIEPSFANNLTYTHGESYAEVRRVFRAVRNGEAPGGQWSGVFNFGTAMRPRLHTNLGNTGFAYANALLGNFQHYPKSTARPFTNLGAEARSMVCTGSVEGKSATYAQLRTALRLSLALFPDRRQGSNFDPALFNPGQRSGAVQSLLRRSWRLHRWHTCPTANQRATIPVIRRGGDPNARALTPISYGRSFPARATQTMVLHLELIRIHRRVTDVPAQSISSHVWDLPGTFLARARQLFVLMGGVYHAPRVGGGTTGGNLVNNPPANRSFQHRFRQYQ